MKKVLFINPDQPRCGVHQYGLRLFSILKMSVDMDCAYETASKVVMDAASLNHYDVVIYNVHPLIENSTKFAPIKHCRSKQVAIYHDGAFDREFDLWIFSDPSSPPSGSMRTIGRPLPEWKVIAGDEHEGIIVGLSGLVGAWAETMVQTVLQQIPEALIRLHLPGSDHCDPQGETARSTAVRCGSYGFPGQVTADHEFKNQGELCRWLSGNDLNCYIRTPVNCDGISSALDLALAVGRPICINRHQMFRHLTRHTPEICIENTPMKQILEMGITPLQPHMKRNAREFVLGEIERAILKIPTS